MLITVLLIITGIAAIMLIIVGVVMESSAKRHRASQEAGELTPPSIPKRAKALFLLIPVAVIGIAGAALFLLVQWRMAFDASADWLTTPGLITRGEIDVEYRDGNDIIIGNDEDARETKYHVYLTYTYTVGNQPYSNNDRNFGLSTLIGFNLDEDLALNTSRTFDTRRQAEHYLGSYRTGQTVTVLYNPDNPKQAVLERSFDDHAFYIGMGVSIAFAAAGLISLVVGIGSLFNSSAKPTHEFSL